MATILNRYDSIMAMNVCGMIEFAEDPMKMARHLEHHMEDDRSAPNAEALLIAKKAELMKLHEIHEKLKDQLHQITTMKMAIYNASYRKK